MGKRALIIGITGQDGSYLAEYLFRKKATRYTARPACGARRVLLDAMMARRLPRASRPEQICLLDLEVGAAEVSSLRLCTP
jgi:GDP-D-mannose dehydratase